VTRRNEEKYPNWSLYLQTNEERSTPSGQYIGRVDYGFNGELAEPRFITFNGPYMPFSATEKVLQLIIEAIKSIKQEMKGGKANGN
jgi:hypothetical protein